MEAVLIDAALIMFDKMLDARALMTAVLADATNLGLTRMARSSGAFSHSRLLWVAEWHVRDETYQAVLACLVDAIHGQPFTRIGGDGDTSSPDGQFSHVAPLGWEHKVT